MKSDNFVCFILIALSEHTRFWNLINLLSARDVTSCHVVVVAH